MCTIFVLRFGEMLSCLLILLDKLTHKRAALKRQLPNFRFTQFYASFFELLLCQDLTAFMISASSITTPTSMTSGVSSIPAVIAASTTRPTRNRTIKAAMTNIATNSAMKVSRKPDVRSRPHLRFRSFLLGGFFMTIFFLFFPAFVNFPLRRRV